MRGDAPAVTLHVGTAKSGTTSLQRTLARNRALLREHGHLYPGTNASHFVETLSLRGIDRKGHHVASSDGAWERVSAEVRAHDGPALLSHEFLAGCTRETIERAVASFGGRPVRVVITCRDLGRQLPAVWQEGVKNRDPESYAEFLAATVDAWRGPSSVRGTWRGQNLAAMGERWGSVVGAEQVHLVTVPPPGADPAALWERFRAAVGLPDLDYALPAAARNTSLGTVETELLRRLVLALPGEVAWPTFTRQVKRRLVKQRLGTHKSGGSLTVPDDLHETTRRIAGEMLEAVRAAGHPVVGDLGDLTPSFAEGTLPDDVTSDQLLARALEVLVPLVLADGADGPDERPRRGAPQP